MHLHFLRVDLNKWLRENVLISRKSSNCEATKCLHPSHIQHIMQSMHWALQAHFPDVEHDSIGMRQQPI